MYRDVLGILLIAQCGICIQVRSRRDRLVWAHWRAVMLKCVLLRRIDYGDTDYVTMWPMRRSYARFGSTARKNAIHRPSDTHTHTTTYSSCGKGHRPNTKNIERCREEKCAAGKIFLKLESKILKNHYFICKFLKRGPNV